VRGARTIVDNLHTIWRSYLTRGWKMKMCSLYLRCSRPRFFPHAPQPSGERSPTRGRCLRPNAPDRPCRSAQRYGVNRLEAMPIPVSLTENMMASVARRAFTSICPPLGREFNCVVKEVHNHLLQPTGIRHYERKVFRAIHENLQTRAFCLQAQTFNGWGNDFGSWGRS